MSKRFLTEEWHGVPEGTKLIVCGSNVDWQGNQNYVVRRADGELLPSPGGVPQITATIARYFVSQPGYE